jgi:hypothetical protein
MTKYQLANGTTIMISTELLLKLTDEQLRDYLAGASGFEINDPFFDSVLTDGEDVVIIADFPLPAEANELPEGFIEEEE